MNATESSDEARFEGLIAEHGALLKRVCFGYERDPAKREELEQDILVAVWRALPGFRGEASVTTWLLRIAHNRAATHAARHMRRKQPPLEPAEHAPGLDESLDQERARRRLADRVAALPLRDRQLMLLYPEGLGSRQIAEVTGTTVTGVTTRIHRLKAALVADLRAPEAS